MVEVREEVQRRGIRDSGEGRISGWDSGGEERKRNARLFEPEVVLRLILIRYLLILLIILVVRSGVERLPLLIGVLRRKERRLVLFPLLRARRTGDFFVGRDVRVSGFAVDPAAVEDVAVKLGRE